MAHPIHAWLATQQDAMEALLAELVNIDSGSQNQPGIEAVRQRIKTFFAEHAIPAADIPTEGGECLMARTGPASNGGHVLLMGHMDTVFPEGEVAARPYSVEMREGRRVARGPGCADMKAGLVMNAFLLAGFHATGGAPIPVAALYTRDEEIGSRFGREAIEGNAGGARAVFNAEPGRASGNVVKGRRGGSFYRLRVHGRAAHAGGAAHLGRSAIEEMARKIIALHALNSEEPDLTVTVNMISGGTATNTIPALCEATIDTRFGETHLGEALGERIREIAETCARDGLSGELIRAGTFLPVIETPENQTLVNLYLDVARDLGQSTDAEFTRSCADSGFTANMGVPTVCGTGPVGGLAHSPDEYVELDSFVPRAQAVAGSILRLAAG
jgi:glutamate carboxypeptidase